MDTIVRRRRSPNPDSSNTFIYILNRSLLVIKLEWEAPNNGKIWIGEDLIEFFVSLDEYVCTIWIDYLDDRPVTWEGVRQIITQNYLSIGILFATRVLPPWNTVNVEALTV